MDMNVLGTLAVRHNGVSVTPAAPKPRQVLALLALRAGQVVPVGVLAEELWGAAPPRSARTTLQTYILQLRELISTALGSSSGASGSSGSSGGAGSGRGEGPGAGEGRVLDRGLGAGHGLGRGLGAGRGVGGCGRARDVLVTVPGGYLLRCGDGASDVREFERLAGCGYRAMDTGDHPRAARLLRRALELWSGPALAGVRIGPQLRVEARRLEESRLCALDQRVEADLRLGRHRELLAELTVLVSQYPMHESLCGQYMLALHRCGRRGEALDAYRRLRATLVRALGLEPSPALARLQRSVLMSGPGPLPARPTSAAAATGVVGAVGVVGAADVVGVVGGAVVRAG
ncbi:BTAD domain-containing putative transcriptional regulator [Streptomyces sp. NPDC001914]|uniref:AfsR/SARP family transcriptional regulator n=1 Tax=Streptomyces sp. NPDC001914 TaxID=3364623 RepID=UPI0036BAA724